MTLQRRKRATAREVAERSGVSQSTVSRVLAGVPTTITISPETRARILDAAEELGYVPNHFARALKTHRSSLLGVILRDITDPFFARVLREIGVVARTKGYHILLGNAESNPLEATVFGELFSSGGCDGLLVVGDIPHDEESLHGLVARNNVVVGLCRGAGRSSPGMPVVNTDNAAGTALALDYLHSLGHRRIACIASPWLGDVQDRARAYSAHMEARGLPAPPEYLQVAANDMAGGYRAMRALLALVEPPTAVFACDDEMAVGAVKAAADAQLPVPAALSIVGFDDIAVSTYTVPALTTVSQPLTQLAESATLLLIEMIEGKGVPEEARDILITPQLVLRGSCAPPCGDR
jgi:DNA-binding LacI/PurR family transcriptional regulator